MPAMVAATAGFDPDVLAGEMRLFLAESETVYFAALRRFLAEIDIEQGDASRVDLEHVIRGGGLGPLVRSAPHAGRVPRHARRAGHRSRRAAEHLLDLQPRPLKSARAFCAPVNVPNDVRLVIQPRGGWDDYAALLHEGGHAEHFAHVDPALPVPWRLLGDNSLTEGYGLLFERLVGDPAWLRHIMGMPEDDAAAFADFNAFWYLRGLRGRRGPALPAEPAPRRGPGHRARGVRRDAGADARRALSAGGYLEIDDNLYVARYARAAMVAGSLSAWLQSKGGEAWWTSRENGDALKRSWARGQEWNAQDVVAHLGV